MMSNVKAWQHIYTNVEKEQSPHNRGGFQTLFYTTSALTEDEVEEMEARLLYFASEITPVKQLFFTTSTGKRVVAQIVPLARRDRLGRKGRYLAHSLVLAPEAFAQLGNDPLSVLQNFPFVSTVTEALERGDFQTGNIPTISLDLATKPEANIKAAKKWSVPELKKLTLLALRAAQMSRDRLTVAFQGPPPQVESALAAAFLAVPTPLRPHCSFDNYFYRCNPVSTTYWAVGLLERPSNPRFTVVDLPSRQIRGAVKWQPENAYEKWVTTIMNAETFDLIARHKDHAFALCRWLEGHSHDASRLDSAPGSPLGQVVDSVFEVNRQQVQTRLRNKLEALLPTALANRIFDQFYGQSDSQQLFGQLREGFKLPDLLEILYDIYQAQKFKAPPSQEIRAIGKFLQQEADPKLRLLHAYWTGQHEPLRQELERLSEEEYRTFVESTLRKNLVESLVFFVPSRAHLFLNPYLGSRFANTRLALIEALLASGEAASLSRLIPYIPRLSEREVRVLAKRVDKRTDVPEAFQRAIRNAQDALPPTIDERVKGFFRSLSRR